MAGKLQCLYGFYRVAMMIETPVQPSHYYCRVDGQLTGI